MFLKTTPKLLWCPDCLHLLKLSRYRIVGNVLSLAFKTNDNLIKLQDLKHLFIGTAPEVFLPEQNNKMRDDIAL